MSLKIAIVGAGPVGCMLARLLHNGGIDAVVYEGEVSPDYRSQGGSLDLHIDTGLAALHEAGLFSAFLQKARYDGEHLLMCDHRLHVLYQEVPKDCDVEAHVGKRPEIDRAALRQLLTESLPAGMIRWGHRLQRATRDPKSGRIVLVFADGATATGFDLVVGADGTWSKVRTLLSDQLPLFSGIAGHDMYIPDAATTAPDVARLVNRGTVFAQAEGGRKLALQQMGDGSVHVSMFVRQTTTPNVPLGTDRWYEHCDYDPYDVHAVQDVLLRPGGPFADFAPLLRKAIRLGQCPTTPRSLYMLPVGFRWPHQPDVTLVGDAAHLMTPFAGEGVNTGLNDARHLARAILGVARGGNRVLRDTLLETVCGYETEMWTHSARITKVTDDLARTWFFTPGCPQQLMPSVLSLHASIGMWRPLVPVVKVLIHVYCFLQHLLVRERVVEMKEERKDLC